MNRTWILSALAAAGLALAGPAWGADAPAPADVPAAAFQQALALFEAGKFAEASAAFADCAAKFPEAPRADKAVLYAALSAYRAGDLRQAIERLQARVTDGAHAKDPESLLWLGRAYLADHRPAEAARCCQAILDVDHTGPLAGDAMLSLGEALGDQGQWAEAAAAYQALVAELPDHPRRRMALGAAAVTLHRAGQPEESESFAKQFLLAGRDDNMTPQVLYVSGENRFQAKDYAGAAERYKVLVETRADAPEAPAARVRLAWAEFYQGNFDAALVDLDRLDLRRAAKDVQAEAEYLRGNCLLEKKENDRAAEAFGRYVAAAATGRYRGDALLRQAVALARAGKRAEAAGRFQAYVREAPMTRLMPEVEYQLAEMLLGLGGREDEAIAHFQVVVTRFAGHRLAPYAAYGIAAAYQKKGSPADAAFAFGRLAERFEASALAPQALYEQAVSLDQARRPADARVAYQALLDGYPKSDLAPAALVGLGASLAAERKFDEAADTLRRAMAAPDAKIAEAAAYELARALQRAGRDREAADAWQTFAGKFAASPLAAEAYYQLAESPYKARQFAAASALCEKALGALRDARLKDRILYRLGWSRRGEGRWADAAAAFDRLVAETPESDLATEAALDAGDSYLQAGRPADAIARLAPLADPRRGDFARAADARLRLGEAQRLLGRSEEAVATLADLQRVFPRYAGTADVEFCMGRALYDLKRYEQARQRLEKAATGRTATAAKAEFYVGETHLAAGDPHEALRTYQKVVSTWSGEKEWAAAAQYEMGQCYRLLDQPEAARAAFQTILDKYGDTRWADPARAAVNHR